VEVNPVIEHAQRQRLEQVRRRRDPKRIADLLTQLSQAAESDENMMPLFIECVEADLTLGEICHRLREVWGEYQPPLIL
jgi:methylmalonyl-CoA mutase N-terminal domain/subunit